MPPGFAEAKCRKATEVRQTRNQSVAPCILAFVPPEAQRISLRALPLRRPLACVLAIIAILLVLVLCLSLLLILLQHLLLPELALVGRGAIGEVPQASHRQILAVASQGRFVGGAEEGLCNHLRPVFAQRGVDVVGIDLCRDQHLAVHRRQHLALRQAIEFEELPDERDFNVAPHLELGPKRVQGPAGHEDGVAFADVPVGGLALALVLVLVLAGDGLVVRAEGRASGLPLRHLELRQRLGARRRQGFVHEASDQLQLARATAVFHAFEELQGHGLGSGVVGGLLEDLQGRLGAIHSHHVVSSAVAQQKWEARMSLLRQRGPRAARQPTRQRDATRQLVLIRQDALHSYRGTLRKAANQHLGRRNTLLPLQSCNLRMDCEDRCRIAAGLVLVLVVSVADVNACNAVEEAPTW
mmetsp:Transcript_49080/g.158513  ORF Transcript_49080/g.158513 Transcript_49080/m.158513 type:complete len:412 (+) Transcript_49080:283-1518(+)